MEKLWDSILNLGDKFEYSALQSVVIKESAGKLQAIINAKLTTIELMRFLKYVFGSLTHSGPCQSKRLKLIECTLEELRTRDLTYITIGSVLSVLNCQIRKLLPSHLVQIVQWSLRARNRDEEVKDTLWQEVLPNLLSIANNLKTVEYSGRCMTGPEFKNEMILTLCLQTWRSNMVTAMAAMFVKLELTPQEHNKVVYKLLLGMKTMEPASMPPLVTHLLKLTEKEYGLQMILHLREYYCEHLYDKIRSSCQGSSSDDSVSSIGDPAFTRSEVMRSESTVLYCIRLCAGVGYSSVKEFLRKIKNASTAPELCLNPFFITMMFSVSFVELYQRDIYEMICKFMMRAQTESSMKKKSSWLHEVVPADVDLDHLFHQLLSCCGKEREMVRKGLVTLAFALLKLGTHRTGAPEIWKWGVLILVQLARKHCDVIKTVVEKLKQLIVIMKDIDPYTDVVLKMCVAATLKMGEHQSNFIDIIENAICLRASTAERVFASLMPLIKNFNMIRDRTLVILRKSTFSRKLEYRLMGVRTYLRILKVFDDSTVPFIKNSCILLNEDESPSCSWSSTQLSSSSPNNSQSSSGSSNPMTQVYVHVEPRPNVEDLSREIMKAFQRIVSQQFEIRSALYTGLYPAVFKNEVLYCVSMDFLDTCISKYYEQDELQLPPLHFSQAVGVNCSNGPEEPLGQLVFLIQKLVTNGKRFSNINQLEAYVSLRKLLDSLVERMIKCSPSTFDLNDDVNLTDSSPEGKILFEVFLQVLQVYESLMAYTVTMWYLYSEDRHQTLILLFKNYSKFLELGKKGCKTPKGKKGKQTEKRKVDRKGAAKVRAILKNPPTILDLDSTICLLKLLFCEPLSWATEDQARGLRSRREFSRYVLQMTMQLLQRQYHKNPSDLDLERTLSPRCQTIGRVLYFRFLKNKGENQVADPQIIALALECLCLILQIVQRFFNTEFSSWLNELVLPEQTSSMEQILSVAIPDVTKCLELSLDSGEESDNDPASKKIPYLLACVLSHLCCRLPRQCQVTKETFNWIKRFIMERSLLGGPIVKEIISTLFKMQIQHQTDGALFDKVAVQLLHLVGPLDSEKPVAEPVHQYNMLSEHTQVVWMQQLYLALKHMLNDVDWMVNRMRGQIITRYYPGRESWEEDLAKQEQDVCTHISHCVQVSTILAQGAFPEGPMVDCVLKLLFSLYSSLSNLAKYFTMRSTKSNPVFEAARFPTVVNLAGKKLAAEVQWFVLHAIAPDDSEDAGKKKYSKEKAVRRASKDIKLVPRVGYALELFQKHLLHLSKKCKVDLVRHVKMLSGRDFRINSAKVKESLARQRQEKESEPMQLDSDGEEDAGPSAKRLKKQ